MAWWQYYLVSGLVIALIWETYDEICVLRGSKINQLERELEKAIKEEHVQRETFGERVVLHARDDLGKGYLVGYNFLKYMEQKQKPLIFIIRVLFCTVAWPYKVYDFARH